MSGQARYIEKRRDGRFRLALRVPADLIDDVGSRVVRRSLHTADEVEALAKARAMVDEIRAGWDDLRIGRTDNATGRFDAARRISRRSGFPYKTLDEISVAPVSEQLARIETATPASAPALLGTVEATGPVLSGLVDEVAALKRVDLARKSEMQRHRWRLARDRAARNLIERIGDKQLAEITREDALEFFDWWGDRMLREGLSANSPNKDLEYLSAMINQVSDAKRLNIDAPFRSLRFKAGITRSPHPITADEIRDHVLDALPKLNPAARAIVEILIQTGLRPSEACNLTASMIVLDSNIPHIHIQRRADRDLKTANATRRIPLVGRALEAARAWPNGFETYQDREASLCATVGKWLRTAMPPRDLSVSAYSFRHGFQDRLTAAAPPERVNADLMGHAISRERYGAGPSLEQLLDVMRDIRVE